MPEEDRDYYDTLRACVKDEVHGNYYDYKIMRIDPDGTITDVSEYAAEEWIDVNLSDLEDGGFIPMFVRHHAEDLAALQEQAKEDVRDEREHQRQLRSDYYASR